jgi:type IV secretory pathway VirB3-like protein
MKKNRIISTLGVAFSAMALVISVIELFICIEHNLSIFLILVVIVVMTAVLIANILNLYHIIKKKR